MTANSRRASTITRRYLVGSVVVALAAMVAACGSTVTSDEASSMVPTPDRATAGSAGASQQEAAGSSSPRSTTTLGGPPQAAKQEQSPTTGSVLTGRDYPASEVSSVPTDSTPVALTDQDKGYLDDLRASGITVDGIEDQLIGTATMVCSNDPLSSTNVDAVAGQLVSQKRSNLDSEDTAALMRKNAKERYCS